LEYISCFIGAGFTDDSLAEAITRDLAFIGADAGTIDVGPYQLAGVGNIFSEDLCRHDLRRLLVASAARRIPLIIGSCGGAGSNANVEWFARLTREIAQDEGLNFKVAKIFSEVDRDYLKQKLRAGRIRPLSGAQLTYDEDTIDRSERIVGVMGAEPIIAALSEGADVVLAGRTTDSAIFAALPAMRGWADGVAWHAGKVAECGAAIAEPARNDLLHVCLEDDAFRVAPLNPAMRCTPWSVATHQLYENADPRVFVEPSGVLDASQVQFDQYDESTVRISGARFDRAGQSTMKLEGVELAGYQSIAMMSFNDRVLLETFPVWLADALRELDTKVRRVYGSSADAVKLSVRPYGAGDGTSLFPTRQPSTPTSEVFLLLDAVAPTQQLASGVANIGWHTLCHFPTKGWSGGFVTAAWPYNPPVIERGPVYRFNVNHVVEVDDPLEIPRFEYEEVGR
jgi:hypothetical protein